MPSNGAKPTPSNAMPLAAGLHQTAATPQGDGRDGARETLTSPHHISSIAPTSRAQRMQQRFHERRRVRLVSAAIFAIASIGYFAWRLTILNHDALAFSLALLAAEFFGFLIAASAVFSALRHRARAVQPPKAGLAVDVFIPVYREPVDVIRRTLEAACDIAYPHRTIVLDDGRRPEIKRIAEALGCTYLSRAQNTHAKAGNLNFGLAHSTADFVVVFDADHIALPDALHTLLGFFDNPDLAFVQAPQTFYNTSCLQFCNARGGATWHDQSFFYNVAMANADAFNAASCVGTGVAYRRAALDAIGGIPVETVTEDMHTSIKLHKAGWQSCWIAEPVARGIGESSLADYYKVRLRWAHGNLHALREENVLFGRGLTLGQRMSYLIMGLNTLEGWQYLLFYLVPIVSLLTGIPPFEITLANIAIMIVYPLFTFLLLQELACGYGRFWANELYAMMRLPVAILATVALVRDRMAWSSGRKSQEGRVEWALMTPQLAIVAVSLGALAYGVAANWGQLEAGPLVNAVADPGSLKNTNFTAPLDVGYNLDLLILAGFWALANVARGGMFVWKVAHHARRTHADYRFDVDLTLAFAAEGEIREVAVYAVKRASLSVLELAGDEFNLLPVGTRSLATLRLTDGAIEVVATPQRVGSRPVLAIDVPDPGERQRLERCLYRTDWQQRLGRDEATFRTPLGAIEDLIALTKKKRSRVAAAPTQPVAKERGNPGPAITPTHGIAEGASRVHEREAPMRLPVG
ncbi:MAG: glycosyltransferase, partial [Pseudomonadota bacterium]